MEDKMEDKKKREILQALSELDPDDTGVSNYAAIYEVAHTHRILPSTALRLVQHQLAAGYHDKLSSGQPDSRVRPVRYEICFGKACLKRGARDILNRLESLAVSETSGPDRRPVKIKTCSCLHRCSKGPIVRVDGILHEKFPVPE